MAVVFDGTDGARPKKVRAVDAALEFLSTFSALFCPLSWVRPSRLTASAVRGPKRCVPLELLNAVRFVLCYCPKSLQHMQTPAYAAESFHAAEKWFTRLPRVELQVGKSCCVEV